MNLVRSKALWSTAPPVIPFEPAAVPSNAAARCLCRPTSASVRGGKPERSHCDASVIAHSTRTLDARLLHGPPGGIRSHVEAVTLGCSQAGTVARLTAHR
jgi:hypothetical protein